jgi:hypothetical protein
MSIVLGPVWGAVLLMCPKQKRPSAITDSAVSSEDYFDAAHAVSSPKAFRHLSKGFENVHDSRTVDAWVNERKRIVLVAVRGTQELYDAWTDLHIPMNALESSPGYAEVVKEFLAVQQRYPSKKYNYFLTGHSLGGALVAALVRTYKFIKRGIVYNPAMQARDFQDPQSAKIARIVVDGDILDYVNNIVNSKNLFADVDGLVRVPAQHYKTQAVAWWVLQSLGLTQHLLDQNRTELRDY